MIKLFNGNCLDVLKSEEYLNLISGRNVIIVTDPPFNIGYHYRSYKDKMIEKEYLLMLRDVFGNYPFVCIHYPESLYKISYEMGKFPTRVVSWVYNSNTAKQHRDIAFFDVEPDFNQVKQPYKNPSDKRIKQRIAQGKIGGRLYDWWEINQVKNISKDKTIHPCQMPLKVMENIIGILPRDAVIVDPFMGSGTTGIACKKYNVDFIGIEQDEKYYNIAKDRVIGYEEQTHLY